MSTSLDCQQVFGLSGAVRSGYYNYHYEANAGGKGDVRNLLTQLSAGNGAIGLYR